MYRKIERQSQSRQNRERPAGNLTGIKGVITVVVVVFLLFSLIKNIIDYQKKLAFFATFQKELALTNKENITLKTEILKSQDPFKIEKTIRDKLNLQRPGEMVFVLPQPTPVPVIVTPTPAPTWVQWWNVFFKN